MKNRTFIEKKQKNTRVSKKTKSQHKGTQLQKGIPIK